jgi:hypothetical protein
MWLLTIQPSFLNELVALPAKEAAQVQKKLVPLTEDPTPDGYVMFRKTACYKYSPFRLRRQRSREPVCTLGPVKARYWRASLRLPGQDPAQCRVAH